MAANVDGVPAVAATIPIVFITGDDPVRLGFVTSLSRPSGNLTGINVFNSEVTAKRMELLRELVPHLARIAVLVNPADANTETQLRAVNEAASSRIRRGPQCPYRGALGE